MTNFQTPENKEMQNLKSFLGKKGTRSNRDVLEALNSTTQLFQGMEGKTQEMGTVHTVLMEVLDQVAVRFELYSTKGFLDSYYEFMPEHSTGKETFEALNNEFEEMTGEKRYQDFESFKTVLGMN